MDLNLLKDLLNKLKDGKIEIDEAIQKLKLLPFEDIGFASIDHHRHLRRGFPEVIYARGKRVEEIIAIVEKMVDKEENVLITRLTDNKATSIKNHFPSSDYYPTSRILTIGVRPIEKKGKGKILVVSAGTADITVAEEAAITATFMGNDVKTLFDVGVAGLHRLLQNIGYHYKCLGDCRCSWHGGSLTKYCWRPCRQTCHCSSNKHWLWSKLRRIIGPFRHA